jgi:hypothetical protein
MTECWRRGYQAPTTRLVPCMASLLPLNGQHPVYIQTSNLDTLLVKAVTITILQKQLHQTMVGLIRTTTVVTSRHNNNSNRTPTMTKEPLHHRRHMPRHLSSFNSHNSPTQTWARIRVEQHRTLGQPIKSLLRLSSSGKCRTHHTLRSPGLLIHRKHLHQPYRTLRVRASTMEIAIQHSHPNPLCNGPPASPHSPPSRHPHNYTPVPRHNRHPSPRQPSLRLGGRMHPILPNKREHRHRNKHLRSSNHHHHHHHNSNNNNNNNNNSRSRSRSRSSRSNNNSSSGSSPTSSSNPLYHGSRRRTQPAGMAPRASRLRHRISCWCSQKL